MKRNITAVVIVLVVALGIWYATHAPQSGFDNPNHVGPQPIAAVSYMCDGGKAIDAAYYTGSSTPAVSPGMPPTPGGSVALSLSDGRTMTLPQTISGSGIRYANAGESIVFWSKGNGAFMLENNQQTYGGCITVAPDPGNLPQAYENGTQGFSMRYPSGYKVTGDYQYQEMGPGKNISGVSFTIPSSTASGTNLGSDMYLSVEEIPQTPEAECSAKLFLAPGGATGALGVATTTENGVEYSVASSTGAGAGNRYEETVYAIPGTNPCIAVRYFIHYGVLENYPADTVTAFDKQGLLDQFNEMRQTLTIVQ